mgnify:CR=1 FL=1|jgi:bifunctional UDP-N-acetylglucosamine pyrophosphorylase/glucosamine-1-phosphate N-acetyltransferase
MRSARPKVLHPLAGRPLLAWVLEALEALAPARIVVVAGPGGEDVAAAAHPYAVATQPVQDGTGGALAAALPSLAGFDGQVLVVMGDVPLVEPACLHALLDAAGEGAAVLAADLPDPAGYGRVIVNTNGDVERIVEEREANAAQRAVRLVNAGAWVLPSQGLGRWLSALTPDNAAGERYLTDLPGHMAQDGVATRPCVVGDPMALRGVNTRADLAALEALVQGRLREKAMAGGVTLADPGTTYLSWDTALAPDVTVGPCVAFGPGVRVDEGAEIRAFSHLEGATVETGAVVGPFARLRPGTRVGAGARVGNFVEIKAATLGAGVKAGHLAYIGDAILGPCVNFSAGAVVANYDGRTKHKTTIGQGAMVGTNAVLVAPVEIGAGAFVAAGSVITKAVPAGALAVARGRQEVKPGRAPPREP